VNWYVHADGLGSITALSNASGSIVQTYSYDSFGNITSTGSITQPFTYTGREYDSETGMYFYRARYYDPKVGRFVTKDPIGFDGGINFYIYVGNNPINLVDPEGLKCATKLMLVTAYCDVGPGSDWPFYKPKNKGNSPGNVGPGTCAVANTRPPAYAYGCKMKVQDSKGNSVYTCEVHDTGAGWNTKHHNVSSDSWIDIWFASCTEAKKWGKQWRPVEVCCDDCSK